MKILVYLEKSAIRGGIEIFAERHVAELHSRGCETVLVQDAGSLPRDFGAFGEIVVHKCPDVATLEKFPPEKTVLYVHDHEPVCPRGYAYTPLGRNCSRRAGVFPCIFCAPLCRSWRAALGRVFSQSRRVKAMSRMRRIVVISDFMKSRLVANGIPPDIVSVEPPHVEPPQGTAVAEAVDILYVGQLIRGKGVHLLLEAFAKLDPSRTLDIVGTGNMARKLESLARSLGVGGRVRFRGFRDNPQDWMCAASCVAVPSFWQEPYGLVAAEAVALGKPVVAFAAGGLPEACAGKAALVPPGDIDAFARALAAIPGRSPSSR